MERSDGDFVDYLRRLGRKLESELGEHPEPETLLAYHWGELDEAAADAVIEHITLCDVCANLVLAIPDFLAVSSPGAEARAAEHGAGIHRLTDDQPQARPLEPGVVPELEPCPEVPADNESSLPGQISKEPRAKARTSSSLLSPEDKLGNATSSPRRGWR